MCGKPAGSISCHQNRTVLECSTSTPPFAKSSRKDRYCSKSFGGNKGTRTTFTVQIMHKILYQYLRCRQNTATVPVFPRRLCEWVWYDTSTTFPSITPRYSLYHTWATITEALSYIITNSTTSLDISSRVELKRYRPIYHRPKFVQSRNGGGEVKSSPDKPSVTCFNPKLYNNIISYNNVNNNIVL